MSSNQPLDEAAVIGAIDRALNALKGMPEFDHPLAALEDIITAEIALGRARRTLDRPKSSSTSI
jgi:hypothetical protein